MKRTTLTPIESFVIVAIVILLPSIITASLQTARDLAKIPLCQNNLKQIGVAVYEYAQIYDGNLPNVLNGNWDEEMHPYMAYRGDKPEHFLPGEYPYGKMIPYRLACLYEAGLIEDARLFYCPAETSPTRMYKSYINPSLPNHSNKWGTLPQQYNVDAHTSQWVRAGYTWFPVDKNPNLSDLRWLGMPILENTCTRFDDVDPNIPYLTDLIRNREYICHSVNGNIGVNALFQDGRVAYRDDPNIFSDPIWDMDPSSVGKDQIMAIYYERIRLLAGQLGGSR